MIKPRPTVAVAGTTARRRRRSILASLVAVLLIAGLLVTFGQLRTTGPAPVAAPVTPSAVAVPSAVPLPPLPPPPTVGATSVAVPQDLVALAGQVPTRGAGTFTYAPGRGRVLGTKGELRRFKVAVEKGSNEDVVIFAGQVEATLGDRRSWIGDGKVRLQRVPAGEKANFTVYLATRDTAGRMCRTGGVNITVNGRPYTSCRSTGRVIINLDRWRLSARPYREAKVPLPVYRQYVLNHETGHELGQNHEGCPKRGGPAPVMVQQTLTLRGCVPYAWPRRDNKRFAGPAL